MAAAKVAELAGPVGPVSESVARELAPLREDPAQLTEVWQEAQALAGSGTPTAGHVIAAREANQTVEAADPAPQSSPVMLTLRTHEGTGVPYPQPKAKATFNATNEHISWAAWTWNPVTGCLHGCDYCYARELATKASFAAAYPVGFTPLFHSERLDAPANTPVPQDAATDPRRGRVFVCSMADLFGRWVPQEWIDQVHAACTANPQWDYLMLTKFPERYVGLDLPRTAWLGTSVDEQKRVRIAEKAFSKIPRDDVRVRWLSLEPHCESPWSSPTCRCSTGW